MACACEMGAGMWWMMALPALFLVGLAVAGAVAIRAVWNRRSGDDASGRAGVSVLEERYARGELDRDELVRHFATYRTKTSRDG